MKNWSVDAEQLKRNAPEAHERWRLEQLINYGLDGERLSREALRKHWQHLRIDPRKREAIESMMPELANAQRDTN